LLNINIEELAVLIYTRVFLKFGIINSGCCSTSFEKAFILAPSNDLHSFCMLRVNREDNYDFYVDEDNW